MADSEIFYTFAVSIVRMKRNLLILSVGFILALFVPTKASSYVLNSYAAGVMDLQDNEITISFSQESLCVSGGEGMMLEIISLTGKKIMEQQIDSPAQKFELNIPKGCYIVRVGKVVRKVSIH